MIFLVGLRRSGTNWLERIVQAHPDVVVIPGETYLFGRAVRSLQTQVRHTLPDADAIGSIYATRPSFLAATRAYCDTVLAEAAAAVDPHAFHIVERTPLHVFDLDLIGAVYPDARVVHIIRDGRDVARSVLSMDWGPQTVADAAREWRRGINAARAASPALAGYTEVRYEELLADPEGGIARVYEALGLSTTTAVMETARQAWSTPFNTDPADPRIGHGKWAQTWSPEDERVFDDIAGELLRELGYGAASRAGPATASRAVPAPSAGAPARPSTRRGLFPRRWRSVLGRRDPAVGQGAAVAEALLDRLSALDFRGAAAMLSPDAEVRVRTGEYDWFARGPQAADALVATLQTEVASWGRPDRTEVIPDGDQVVTLLCHNSDGRSTQRVLAVESRRGAVGRLLYLHLPSGQAEFARDAADVDLIGAATTGQEGAAAARQDALEHPG